MITVTADFTVNEKDAAAAEALLKQLAAAVATEPGNVRYEILRLRQSPPVFRVYERYVSSEAFEEHKASAHLRNIFPEIRKLLAAPSVVAEYDFIADVADSRT